MRRRSSVSVLFAAAFLAFFAASPALGGGRTSTQGSFLQAVNAARAAHGLAPLHLDAGLGRAARAHTTEMLRGNSFAHGDFGARMGAFGLRGMLGENLAWGTGPYGRAQTIVQLWLASPGHRANLLRAGFHRIGFGIAVGAFQGEAAATVVTADFGA